MPSYQYRKSHCGDKTILHIWIRTPEIQGPACYDKTSSSPSTCVLTCIVTSLSSTMTSFVKKSAPIVALYWLLNFLFTYWFINDVLPTLKKKKCNNLLSLEHQKYHQGSVATWDSHWNLSWNSNLAKSHLSKAYFLSSPIILNGCYWHRDQSCYAPSPWETPLQCNDVSHWLVAYLNWSLLTNKISWDLSFRRIQGWF